MGVIRKTIFLSEAERSLYWGRNRELKVFRVWIKQDLKSTSNTFHGVYSKALTCWVLEISYAHIFKACNLTSGRMVYHSGFLWGEWNHRINNVSNEFVVDF